MLINTMNKIIGEDSNFEIGYLQGEMLLGHLYDNNCFHLRTQVKLIKGGYMIYPTSDMKKVAKNYMFDHKDIIQRYNERNNKS